MMRSPSIQIYRQQGCLKDTTWFTGPAFLSQPEKTSVATATFELVDPEQDKDVRIQVTVLTCTTHDSRPGSHCFERFLTWRALNCAICCLRHVARLFKKTSEDSTGSCKGWHHCGSPYTVEELKQSKNIIIRSVQQETYAEEMECTRTQRDIPKDSSLRILDPFIDEYDLLRVGGRIQESQLGHEEKRPLVIPGRHHVAYLLVQHYYVESQHQGRHFTEGGVRSAGYWIVGAKRCVSSFIFKCITCLKFRGTCEVQKMADLPPPIDSAWNRLSRMLSSMCLDTGPSLHVEMGGLVHLFKHKSHPSRGHRIHGQLEFHKCPVKGPGNPWAS